MDLNQSDRTQKQISENIFYYPNERLSFYEFGKVYKGMRCFDCQNVPCAVKVLKIKKKENQDIIEREIKAYSELIEIQRKSEIERPNEVLNIASIYEVIKSDDIFYIVMERSLGTLHGQRFEYKDYIFPELDATQMILDISRGLSFLSERNFILRRIGFDCIHVFDTPNISQKYAYKLADFGTLTFSNQQEELEGFYLKGKSTIETIQFTAPERLINLRAISDQNQQLNFPNKNYSSSYIWSLGVLFHMLLTGERLFQADHQKDMIDQIFQLNNYYQKWVEAQDYFNNLQQNVNVIESQENKNHFEQYESWYNYSNKDLANMISKMLDPNPETRIGFEQLQIECSNAYQKQANQYQISSDYIEDLLNKKQIYKLNLFEIIKSLHNEQENVNKQNLESEIIINILIRITADNELRQIIIKNRLEIRRDFMDSFLNFISKGNGKFKGEECNFLAFVLLENNSPVKSFEIINLENLLKIVQKQKEQINIKNIHRLEYYVESTKESIKTFSSCSIEGIKKLEYCSGIFVSPFSGISLYDYINNPSTFSDMDQSDIIISKMEIIKQIAIGIQSLHKIGVYHCELNPQTIFSLDSPKKWAIQMIPKYHFTTKEKQNKLGKQQTVKDLERWYKDSYRSPQQLRENSETYHSSFDLWSLGCIAHFIIAQTNIFPFCINGNQFIQQSEQISYKNTLEKIINYQNRKEQNDPSLKESQTQERRFKLFQDIPDQSIIDLIDNLMKKQDSSQSCISQIINQIDKIISKLK